MSNNSQHNIYTLFQLPSSVPKWTPHQGGGFASGTIDLGGLAVTHVTSFKKIWSTNEGGSGNLGTTFYDPVAIPNSFSSLGSYAHSNNIPLFGHFLVAKDVSNDPYNPSLKSPIDYVLKWTSHSLNITKDGECYVWLPIAPRGYKAIGYVITSSFDKPTLDKVSCVRQDFTEDHTTAKKTISNDDDDNDDDDDLIRFENQNVIDMNGLHVHSSMGGFKIKNDEHSIGKLKGSKANNAMPNIFQIRNLISAYSPIVYFHPDEEYLPSSVDWFFESGALLYHNGSDQGPIPIQKNGANLPQGGPTDRRYWLDLPVDGSRKDKVKIGTLKNANAYFHVKPVAGGLFSDISVWIFHPFNGASIAKVLFLTLSLKPVGEHVGDWEHMTLRISNINGELNSVCFARHSWGEWVSASALEWDDANGKIVAYSSLHSHGLYSKSGIVSYGWKGAKVAGLIDKMAMSNKIMDTGVGAVVVAAEYLGNVVVEPPWLNYMRKWGPSKAYEIVEVLTEIKKDLKWYERILFGKIIEKLPRALLGEDGPTGPKAKKSWSGDEELNMVQPRAEAI
ncbi:hypothetical protein At1g04090-like [Rutidosis leptorrhynchoides]|uniref:hypothetical protein At1g04090-like n=1 Tax=Rutidosis leptorrhynchoides TaxID=125765 RepID=UPI003A99BE60